jgi:hypothetical protein
MKDSRILKQLVFGELVEGRRPVGRPPMVWIDCIAKDLEEFGFPDSKKNWPAIKETALDREKWRKAVTEDGISLAHKGWMRDNTDRRTLRMISKGINPRPCLDITGERLPEEAYLSETPLLHFPDSNIRKLIKQLGEAKANEIFTFVDKVKEGVKKREMEEFTPYGVRYITTRLNELQGEKEAYLKKQARDDDINVKRILRDILIGEWLPNSNTYDETRDKDEMFEVEAISGYRCEKGLTNRKVDQYVVIYKSRVYPADSEYPEELPEVIGLPWPTTNWQLGSKLPASLKSDFKTQLAVRKKLFKVHLQLIENMDEVE